MTSPRCGGTPPAIGERGGVDGIRTWRIKKSLQASLNGSDPDAEERRSIEESEMATTYIHTPAMC